MAQYRRLPPTVSILNARVHCLTEAQAVEHVIGSCCAGDGGWVWTPNVDMLRVCHAEATVHALVSAATLVVADGIPLVWASHLQGTPLPGRVAGSDLIWSLSAAAHRHGLRIYLLGGASGVACRAAEVLSDLYPSRPYVGWHCPPVGFEHDRAAVARIVADIQQAEPDIVFVGLTFPKGERLIAQLRSKFPHVWWIGVGIALSFVSGHIARAPPWMQRCGMEWLHRMVQEPSACIGDTCSTMCRSL